MPLTLTTDQLQRLHQRNSRDGLFVQGLNQYAQQHYPEAGLAFENLDDQEYRQFFGVLDTVDDAIKKDVDDNEE